MDNENSCPTIQIINKKINTKKFIDDDFYHHRKRLELRREVKENSDLILVNLVLSESINEKWALECMLDLQREFTDIVIIPPTDIQLEKINEWRQFNSSRILKSL